MVSRKSSAIDANLETLNLSPAIQAFQRSVADTDWVVRTIIAVVDTSCTVDPKMPPKTPTRSCSLGILQESPVNSPSRLAGFMRIRLKPGFDGAPVEFLRRQGSIEVLSRRTVTRGCFPDGRPRGYTETLLERPTNHSTSAAVVHSWGKSRSPPKLRLATIAPSGTYSSA